LSRFATGCTALHMLQRHSRCTLHRCACKQVRARHDASAVDVDGKSYGRGVDRRDGAADVQDAAGACYAPTALHRPHGGMWHCNPPRGLGRHTACQTRHACECACRVQKSVAVAMCSRFGRRSSWGACASTAIGHLRGASRTAPPRTRSGATGEHLARNVQRATCNAQRAALSPCNVQQQVAVAGQQNGSIVNRSLSHARGQATAQHAATQYRMLQRSIGCCNAV
jgi:hypothetical protein